MHSRIHGTAEVDDTMANRMTREALIYLFGVPEDDWGLLESGESHRLLESSNAKAACAVAEIEGAADQDLRILAADTGRGAGGLGAVLEIVGAIAIAGGAAAAVVQAASLVRWAYHRIASATGRRPMISLGAAEHLAMADLIDRVDSLPRLIGSGDVNSSSEDLAFTGGDMFWVVLATESELHSYHISAYGDVYYVGTSPPIPDFMDAPPPYWAGGDPSGD